MDLALERIEKAKAAPPPTMHKELASAPCRGPTQPVDARARSEFEMPEHLETFFSKLMSWIEVHVDPAPNDDAELTRIHTLRDKVMEVYQMCGEDIRIWAYFRGKLDDDMEGIETAALESGVGITFNTFVNILSATIRKLQTGDQLGEVLE